MNVKKILILLMIGLLMACNAEKKSKTFVFCSEAGPSAFNTQITTDGTSHSAAGHTLYNRLVSFKLGTTNIIPSLAHKWDISGDGLRYTFYLRKDIVFHTTKYFTPTRNLNADDVLFSFNRVWKKDHPYHLINGGRYEYFKSMEMGKVLKEIKKIDDYTVEIVLHKREAPFLANMAMTFMSVVSKEYAEKLMREKRMNDFDFIPVGTGPFVFKSYLKDTMIRFTAHKNYFEGAPKIKKLVFSITPDASVRYQKLKAGECHLITEPAPADLQAMKDNKDINLISTPSMNVGYLAMNVEKRPFDNVLVRKAMAHALNKKAYIDAIYLGHALEAKNPLPPTIWSYNKSLKDYEYNVETAKKLLKEAGYPNGLEAELWTLPVTRPYNPNGKKMGEMMQADLAKIGIKVKLITYDWPTYLVKVSAGEHQLVQYGWTGDNGDPDNFLHSLLSCAGVGAGSNTARWCHQGFDQLVTKAKEVVSLSERTALYQKAQVIFKENVPWVPIAHSVIFRAMSNNVRGYKIDLLGGDIFKKVYLAK